MRARTAHRLGRRHRRARNCRHHYRAPAPAPAHV